MNNLLSDRLVRARVLEGGDEWFSLPGLLVSLNEDRILDFPALRPHQRHAWHAFLAQLATITLDRLGLPSIPDTAEEWEHALRSLTAEFAGDEPWCLVVEDPALPAFMQCAAPKGLAEYGRQIATPDDLDLLVTAKNHDVKQTVASNSTPEDWLFALVDLQTMAGFLGAGNYGIARMNGGFSSRPCVGLAPADGGLGAHVFHDVSRMREGRERLLQRFPSYFRPQGGTALLWLEPWDGTDSLDLRSLDPYFIEICRRIRLRGENAILTALAAGSSKPRIEAKAAKGNLGDFWTPVDVKDSKALSVSANGFTYKRLTELLFDTANYQQPPAMEVDDPSTNRRWALVARGVAGGQGKTEGYHERSDIAFSARVARSFFDRGERDRLAEMARLQMEEIAAVTGALRLAVATAASGGEAPSELTKADRAHAAPFARRFDGAADVRFFGALEARFLAPDEDAVRTRRAEFVSYLLTVARSVLAQAVEAVPCPTIRRHRARARAFSTFERDIRKTSNVFGGELEEILCITGEGDDTSDRS